MAKKRNDKEIAREGIASEIEAINLYEQMAKETRDKRVKKVLLDIAKEEKTHLGEFHTVLMREDKGQRSELKAGKKEVSDLTKSSTRESKTQSKKEEPIISPATARMLKKYQFKDTISPIEAETLKKYHFGDVISPSEAEVWKKYTTSDIESADAFAKTKKKVKK